MSDNTIDFSGFDEFLTQFEPELRDELLEAMVTELISRKESLTLSCDEKNSEQIHRQAHGIKGTALTFGLEGLGKNAETLELYHGAESEVYRLAQLLSKEIEAMVSAVEERGE